MPALYHVAIICWAVIGIRGFAAEPVAAQAHPADDRYVVIISIDGFPADALWDARLPLPTIRSLARNGAWAKGMVPSTPSVTWPNHKTLVTGVDPAQHGIMFNGSIIRRGAGEPVLLDNDVDAVELSVYPTLYDVAYEAGLKTAEVNWPNTRMAEGLHDSFPDAVESVTHTTPRLRAELIEMGLLEDGTYEAFRQQSPARRDHVWNSTAIHLIRTRRPNVLLLHLLNVDGTHHRYGVGTDAGITAMAHADSQVGDVLRALDETGIRDRTTIFIVSDHGFMNVHDRLSPNVLLRKHGLLKVDVNGKIVSARVQVVSVGGTAMVFATDPTTKKADLEVAHELFRGAEGISQVLTPQDYETYGLPHPSMNDQVGDLVLAAKDGYAFTNTASGDAYVVPVDGTYASHGYLNNLPEMRALFVASGRGVRSGVELDVIDNRSVASTAAKVLGLSLKSSDGAVLVELLE